jgi:hypothetical protein
MAATQAAIAAGVLKGSRPSTRDAKKAYIQSWIDKPGRPRTWMRLPKSLWPKSWFKPDGTPLYHDPVVILEKSLYGHPESGPMWDKRMQGCMKACGFLPLEGSPGFFYNVAEGVEMTVYVDDFTLIAPPCQEARIWAMLDKHITFKDPAEPLSRYLGVYHHLSEEKDGTVRLVTGAKQYLEAIVTRYMKEAGCTNLPYVPSPVLEDKVDEGDDSPGHFAASASSHLMSILYIARLCRGDLLTTTSFLARRVAPGRWKGNEDRRLRRLMSYIRHHLDTVLTHELKQSDSNGARLVYSPDAELGGDVYSTKASGGYWLHVESADGLRRWPVCWSCKKAGHTSTATADSETWSMVGSTEVGLKREVIPILQQLEVTLGRLVLLECREDNTQCIQAIRKGYSPALRHLKRHINLGLGFAHEVFYPDLSDSAAPVYWSTLRYCESKDQLGDMMTKELAPKAIEAAVAKLGYRAPRLGELGS